MRAWHYLYFPKESTASTVANRLKDAGYAVEVRESPPQWLVLARHELPDQAALEASGTDLERLAASEGGEYDGWERETPAGAAERSPTQD